MEKNKGQGKHLGHHDLVVIGGGPVAVAALWYARKAGLDAIALEAGPHALAVVHGYQPQLILASTSWEWQIDGLPVDCRNPREVTREDLLSYYTRVIVCGRLDVRPNQRVVGIDHEEDRIKLTVDTVEGRAHWTATHVFVTPWFQARALDVSGPGITQVTNPDPAALVSEKVVILGAGLSGLERADALMRAGISVTLLGRGSDKASADPSNLSGRRTIKVQAEQQMLMRVTGSRIISNVVEVKPAAEGTLSITTADGANQTIPCTAVINCTGHGTNQSLVALLKDGGFLSDDEATRLQSATRAGGSASADQVAEMLPPFGDAIWAGRRGVHFVGSIHHVGGISGAGIVTSIETVRWAMGAITGSVQGPFDQTHLPSWFRRSEHSAMLIGQRVLSMAWSDHLAAIVPIPVPSWSRSGVLMHGETPDGDFTGRPKLSSFALGIARRKTMTQIRKLCYDGLTVEELREATELSQEDLLWALEVLWYGNGLSWIPAST